jgi:hypothetical protein
MSEESEYQLGSEDKSRLWEYRSGVLSEIRVIARKREKRKERRAGSKRCKNGEKRDKRKREEKRDT